MDGWVDGLIDRCWNDFNLLKNPSVQGNAKFGVCPYL